MGIGRIWISFCLDEASYIIITLDSNNVAYIAYRDFWYYNFNRATVRKFNGTSWVTVGSSEFSQGEVLYISLVFDSNNRTYVRYGDTANSFKSTVKKYDGTSWMNVGSVGFSTETVSNSYVAIVTNNVP